MAFSPMPLRPYLRGAYKARAANGRCWHFDAWILCDSQDAMTLYVIVQTRRGGRDVLTQHSYRVIGGPNNEPTLRYHDKVPQHAEAMRITDASFAPWYSRLNGLHWSVIRPMAMRRPDTFTYSSVALHYIAAPSLDPIPPGTQNFSPYAKG